MDKQMEPTSQMFSQGGILSRDWFSDKLQVRREATSEVKACVHDTEVAVVLPADLTLKARISQGVGVVVVSCGLWCHRQAHLGRLKAGDGQRQSHWKHPTVA